MRVLEQLPLPLLLWYRENARTLPWRSDPTPYHVWVSEIMLQQTRVVAVLEYYRRFIEALPTVEDLAAVEEDVLMKLWQGLGYYARARNLQRSAQQIVHQWGGTFPTTTAELLTLPGVGVYTAGAIGSICFALPTPAVDGNVLRVVARVTGDDGDIATPAMKQRVTDALTHILPRDYPGDFNQAMMELGATVCLPNGAPLCARCPAQNFCVAHRTERTDALPVKTAKKPRRTEERNVYLLYHQGRVALRRRLERGLLAGLWEFPNTLAGEDAPMDAPWVFLATHKHIFTHIEWHMTAYAGEATEDTLPQGYVWADSGELAGRYAVPSAFAAFVERALTALEEQHD